MSKIPKISMLELSLAQLAIAGNIIIAKTLIVYFPILLLLGLRFICSATFLFLIYVATQKSITVSASLTRRDWLILCAQAACAGFLFNIFMVNGLRYTTATEAGIIMSALPAIIALLSFFILKERLARYKIFAIFIAVLGVFMINLNKSAAISYEFNLIGNLLVIFALIPEGLFTVIAKWHENKLTPVKLAMIVVTINAVVLLPGVFFYLPQILLNKIPLWQMGLFLCYGLFDCIFYIFWYRGLRRIPASIAALFTAVMPVGVTLFAWLLLQEKIDIVDFMGMLLVLFSIVLGSGLLHFMIRPRNKLKKT